MKKHLIIVLLLAFTTGLQAYGQERKVELSSRYDNQRNLIISAKKNAPGTYFVGVVFKEAVNCDYVGNTFTTSIHSSRDILTIHPVHTEGSPRVRYQYYSTQGDPNCTPDTAFVYRLPYSTSISRPVHSLRLLGREARHITQRNVNWHAMQFMMEQGDTIFAARAGLVTLVKEDAEDPAENTSGRITYRQKANTIVVEHTDGTIARYSVLESNSILVQPGDQVLCNTPLGLAGSYDNEYFQLRLQIFYPRLQAGNPLEDGFRFQFHYFHPVFATTAGETKLTMQNSYQPIITEDMIIKEMSKREIRKYQSR